MQFSDTVGSTTMDGSKMDETSQRRSNQEICSSGSDQQLLPLRLRPTVLLLPSPAILVGYAFDYLIALLFIERLNSYLGYPDMFLLKAIKTRNTNLRGNLSTGRKTKIFLFLLFF